ncbi:hypothetical protein SAMN05216567_11628 [Variovorax sp. OK605]|jgi:hypothetical protein|uniref:hypothetical protein n=1 Tax=Variovorax sp. OK605 TaxID=1855317 RepID=UPI0008F2B920|nr:hypothetical protein [Variovorax sp. OK605]SFQ43678.1 hypothetical protein SAMN05216567_11628 [Variovorax sp. OK605]
MDRELLLADLNGYLRAYAEWNMPASDLTHTFSLCKREDIDALDEKSIRRFYADIAEVPAIAVNPDWKTVVVETARRWMTEGWTSAQLAGKCVGTGDGRHAFEETLVKAIQSIVAPAEVVTAAYGCQADKKYAWYAAAWDDLWLGNARGEKYLLHFSVTD